MSTASPRRSDAARNRERLIVEADALFADRAETVTLDMIAKAAGVGIGTLYRHFPTREALVEAVYRLELDALDERAAGLLADHTAAAGMRLWIDNYLHFVSTKRAMHGALRVAITPGASATTVRPRVNAIVRKFLNAGARDGTLRDDVPADDVTLGLVGMVLATGAAADVGQAGRLMDLLMAGLGRRA